MQNVGLLDEELSTHKILYDTTEYEIIDNLPFRDEMLRTSENDARLK